MNIKGNIEKIKYEISEAVKKSGRKLEDINLIAVSKTFPSEMVEQAYDVGVKNFGENYVQDFLSKFDNLKDKSINWHFIGHLQTNKVKFIFDKIYMLHTLDSLKLAEKLNKRLEQENKTLNVLIQVNVGKEITKYGIEEDKVDDFFEKMDNFKNLIVKGFMTIPPFFEEPEKVRPYFVKLRKIYEKFLKYNNGKNLDIEHLSMGMTNDFKIAIEEGATYIRIGTAIFGKRKYKI